MKKHPYYSPSQCLPFRYALRAFLGLALVFTLLGLSPQSARGDESLSLAQPVKVMQQNLYLGADIFMVLQADPEDPYGVPKAVFEIYTDVVKTRFPDRAQALADEIEANMPDLIGLQEVSLFRTESPGDFLVDHQADATVVAYDFLDLILNALSARGLHYRVASVVQNADVELPMLVTTDSNGNPIPPRLDDARLTDRDVILVRSNVITSDAVARNYQTNLSFDFPLGQSTIPIVFKRGYTAVKAKVRGTAYRFVSTHLEVEGGDISPQVPYIQAYQAYELTSVLKNETLPVIVVGDINSSPEDTAPLPLPQYPYFILPPYVQISLAGYADIWPRRILGRNNPGFTCCQEADLLNEQSILDERIDFVFVRNNLGHAPLSFVGLVFAWTIGDTPEDKTMTLPPLWPSDHAGVIGQLRILLIK